MNRVVARSPLGAGSTLLTTGLPPSREWHLRTLTAPSRLLEFDDHCGHPVPRWDLLLATLANLRGRKLGRACRAAAEAWALRFAEAAPGDVRAFAGKQVVGALTPASGPGVIQACDAIAKELDAFLGGICRREFPLIVLQAASRPHFLQCLEVLAGAVEGETRTDSAVCLMTPMPAVLLPSYVDPTLRGTLAHELLHASVQHLDIPVWLNEGLAQIVQERFQAHAVHQMTHEEKRHNVVHWRSAGTLGLWRGDAFHSLDEDCAFAYETSYAIVSNLIVDHGAKAAGRFVRAAGGAEDYGEAAARDVLGVSLSDLAASFLGPGDWSPGGDGFGEGGAGGRWTLDGWVAD